jgi:hypothetical protein
MPSRSYSSKAVVITFNGVLITGLGDATFLTVAKNTDGMELKVGADGESAVAISPDESGLATVTLLNSSPSNDFLSQCANQRTRGVFQAKDLSGRMLINAPDAWVKKMADVTKSKSIESSAWAFESGDMKMNNAGNL